MLAFNTEYDSGDNDHGNSDFGDHDATEVPQVVTDVWHPSMVPYEATPLPEDRSPEICRKHVDAALAILSPKRKDAESLRNQIWDRSPLGVKVVALLLAKIPKNRASEPLSNFKPMERYHILMAIESLRAQLDGLRESVKNICDIGHIPAIPKSDMEADSQTLH